MSTNNQINIVDEIKSRCNIVDVVGRVVPLKKAGSNYKGVCPFHNEKTPSFVVSETKQIYTCFGCGATGDVIGFVERYYNLDFKGAVEMLAKEYGIDLGGTFQSSRSKDELYEINRQAARFFFRALRERANPGYTYMKNRGITEETMNQFGIGFADEDWSSLYRFLKSKGISEEKMMEVGLISHSKGKYFDKFRNRVIFPIMNTAGKVIGFGGRIIGEGEPKYLNSPESSIFQKKNNLYGLNLARKSVNAEDSIILVEGYMDVISVYQAGVRNVSASLGTALTENQARLIKRYTKNVILSYDADQAGQQAAFRGLDILYQADCRAKVLRVTDGKDPDEFIKKNGRNAFLELTKQAMPYGDFKIDMVKRRYDLEDEMQRIDFLRDAIQVLKAMKPVEADYYIRKLAQETGISEGAIRFEYSGNNSQEVKTAAPVENTHSKAEAGKEIPLIEQDLIRLMLLDEKYIDLPEDLRRAAFQSAAGQLIYSGILQIRGAERGIDRNRLKDLLDETAAEALEQIEDKPIPEGREQIMFNDCLKRIRQELLKKQEEQILIRLSMADEEENQKEIIQLTQQLIDIQKKLKE